MKTMAERKNGNPSSLPRGLRNNNAGNIRISKTVYKGEVVPSTDTAFKQFKTRGWGYRAIFVLLESYSKKGFKTIRQMISRYAPENENHTEKYISYVAQSAVVSPDEVLDVKNKNTMILVVCAISKMENGVPANINDVLEGWELYQKHRP